MVSGRRPFSGTVSSLRPLPPVSSKAKDYTDRPDEVVDELDDLRTRGIAKVLNKHFTTTTRQLAIEKAEADSALADLERRRAQTKAFVPSKGGELNPYDQLYVQLQQKRAECRRKEKETMMLYQRYVMKYGKSAKAEPLVSATSSSSSSKETQEGGKDITRSDLNGELPGKLALDTLDENSEITFSKFYEKQREAQEKELQRKEENKRSTQHFMSALNKFMAVTEDENDEHQDIGSNDLISSEDSQSPVVSKDKVDPFMSAVSKFTRGVQEEVTVNDKSLTVTKQEEAIQSDPNSKVVSVSENGTSAVVTPEIKRTPSKEHPPADASDIVAEDESMLSQHVESHSKEDLFPQKPFESGQETENLPASPDLVPKAAAIMLSPASDNLTPKNKVVGVDVNGRAPFFHTVEGYDFDDRSIISELTSANSAVTRQVMDEVETEMEDFIKFEMEAIRKMLDSEEEASTVDPSVRSETSSHYLGDESVHVAMKAEAMAREMEKILYDFAKEDVASVEDSKHIDSESVKSSEHRSETTKTRNVYPYKFEPSIPGEEWYVHFDDNYQKEYYVEKNSNRTQWDYPQKIPSPRKEHEAVSSDDFLSDMVSVASSRRSMSRRSSRRALYRKQRKRRRARRLMMSFLALLCVLVTVFYWRVHHSGESITGTLTALIVSLKTSSFKEIMSGIVDQIEYSLTDRKKMEELIFQQQITLAKIEEERKARELAEQRAREDNHRQMLELQAKEKAAQEQYARVLERQKKEVVKNSEENSGPKGKKGNWKCNIPLAHLHPHCKRVAKENPRKEIDLDFLM